MLSRHVRISHVKLPQEVLELAMTCNVSFLLCHDCSDGGTHLHVHLQLIEDWKDECFWVAEVLRLYQTQGPQA